MCLQLHRSQLRVIAIRPVCIWTVFVRIHSSGGDLVSKVPHLNSTILRNLSHVWDVIEGDPSDPRVAFQKDQDLYGLEATRATCSCNTVEREGLTPHDGGGGGGVLRRLRRAPEGRDAATVVGHVRMPPLAKVQGASHERDK